MRKPSEHLTRLVSFGIGKYTLFLEVGKKHVKKHVKKVVAHAVEHYPKAIALALIMVLAFSQTVSVHLASAATYNFTQSSWSGGATASLASHDVLANRSDWNQYSTKDATTTIANAGANVQINSTVAAVTHTTTADFGAGNTTDNITAGSNAITLDSNFVAISNGSSYPSGFTIALKSDGTVWGWGSNNGYQLGFNDTLTRPVPVQIPGISDVIAISAGYYTVLALKSDGTVWSWGGNTYGQLGDGTTTSRHTPAQIAGLSGITAVETGGYNNNQFSMAVRGSDGAVFAWGDNANGFLGDGNAPTDSLTPVRVVKGAQTDGTDATYLTGIIALSSSDQHTLALHSDGTVYAWGLNAYGGAGSLGDGTSTQRNSPVRVLRGVQVAGSGAEATYLHGITAIGTSRGYYASYAVGPNGVVYSWGFNSNGQLGNGGTGYTQTPVLVSGLTGITQVSGGKYFALARKDDGTAWAWGYNGYGQLGDNSTTQRTSPVQVKGGEQGGTYLTGVVSVEARTIASYDIVSTALLNDGSVYSWGGNGAAILGINKASVNEQTPVRVWGTRSGAFGVKTTNATTSVAMGRLDTYALKSDGTVYSWGYSSYYGHGLTYTGTASEYMRPVYQPYRTDFSAGSGVIAISNVYDVRFALKSDGTVWASGNNGSGQFGNGTSGNTNSGYTQTSISNVKAIAAGTDANLAVKNDGTVWAWGPNIGGEAGTGDKVMVTTPVQVAGLTGMRDVSAGYVHSLALTNDGYVYAWGQNGYGNLGDNTTTERLTPVQVLRGAQTAGAGAAATYLHNIVAISAGGAYPGGYSLALQDDGTVWAWGNNGYGQLGDASQTTRNTAVKVSGTGPGGIIVTAIRAGGDRSNTFSLAVANDTTVYVWGYNGYGLGDGQSAAARTTPVHVKGTDGVSNLSGIVGISSSVSTQDGEAFAAAVGSGGELYMWGYNGYQNLANGTTVNSSIPVSVAGWNFPGSYLNLGASYQTSGTFISSVIDMGQTSAPTTADYTATVPSGTTVTVDVCANNDGGSTWTACVTNVANGGSIGALIGYQYLRYQVNFTGDGLSTPTLSDITLNFANYTNTYLVTLTSSKYDTSSTGNLISKVTWTGTGTSESEFIKFQVRSASTADGLDAAPWCGYGDTGTCTGSNYFVEAQNGVTIPADNPLRTGGDDQYLQYKVTLISGGTATPSLSSVAIQYVVNAPPDFDATYGTNGVSASASTTEGSDWGKVAISYKVRDTDTTSGTSNPGYVTPSFEYSLNGGSSWAAVNSAYLGASDVANKAVGEASYATYTATWDAVGQLGTDTYSATAKIRVTANDNEAALNTATAVGDAFTLDTKVPAVSSFILDASSATSTLRASVTDDSQIVDYVLSNNSDGSADGSNASSGVAQAVGATSLSLDLPWTTTGTTSVAVYLRTRDVYGNTSTSTASAPIAPENVEIKDVSSPNIDTYREFVTWTPFTAASGVVFSKYQLYRSTDGGTNYSLLSEFADSATNYYADSSVASTTTYYYRVRSVDTDGDISNYGSVVNDLPDGQGGTDTVAPVISNTQVDTIGNTSARVTWDTDELSNSAVEYGTTDSYGSTVTNASFVATGHSISLSGLSPNTTYYYRAKSTDVSENVGTGAGGTFTTSGGTVISNVASTGATDKEVTITWDTTTSSNSYVNYSVSSNLASYSTAGSATLVTGTAPFHHEVTITGLTAGITYYYQVKSTDSAENTTTDTNSGSYYSFSTTLDTSAPTISNIIVPVKSETSAVIVWTTDELSTSQVSFGTIASTTAGTYGTVTDLDSTFTINHVISLTDLTASTAYYFRVKSVDSAGNDTESEEETFTSADSGTVTIITSGGGGGGSTTQSDTVPPVILSATADSIASFNAKLTLSVSEPVYVLVNYGEDGNYGQTAGSSALKQAQSVALSGLKPGTTYFYQATVVDAGGNSALSKQGTFKTLFLAESLQNLTLLKNAENYQSQLQDIIESALPSILPPFIDSPTVTDTTEDSATFTFQTNIKSFGLVSLATDADYQKNKAYTADISVDKDKTKSHTALLTNLSPNTKYHVVAKAFVFPEVVGSSGDLTFSTKAAEVAANIVNITTDSFRSIWKTLVPATSIVRYTNTATGVTQEKTDAKLTTDHDIVVDGLEPRTTYTVMISGKTSEGNEVNAKEKFTIRTIVDVTPPAITELKISSALTAGQTNSVQTIISWKTSEPSTSNVSYEEGSGAPNAVLTNKAPDTQGLVQNHIVILTNLKQATIYRVQVASSDAANNTAAIPITTIITPKQNESIVDVIFKNFGTTFSFIK